MKLCVVFADAFSKACYDALGGMGREDCFAYKLLPGVAYSSNLHYEIFQNKSPDEVGFFCDYEFTGASVSRTNRFKRIMDSSNPVNAVVRWGLSKAKLGIPANIPFSEANSFALTGKYLFKQDGVCEVFGVPVEKITENRYDSNIAFDRAEERLREGTERMIVVLNELDHKGHLYGPDSGRYFEAAGNILRRANRLFDGFRQKYPDGICVFMSDHGMSAVLSSVNITNRMYDRFGLPGKDYYFLNDSVYLRLWFMNEEIRRGMTEHFGRIGIMARLDEAARRRFGCVSYKFGEEIYRLKEGYVFDPSCFGVAIRSVPAGMHGFMEETDSASGVVVSTKPLDARAAVSAMDIFGKIEAAIRR